MTISQVARRVGLRASAIRYYEDIGVLPRAGRRSGQRVYDESVVPRLVLVQRAQAAGFTLEEIRRLFFGFRPNVTASERWRRLAAGKLAELDERRRQLDDMAKALRSLRDSCTCATLDACGKALLDGR